MDLENDKEKKAIISGKDEIVAVNVWRFVKKHYEFLIGFIICLVIVYLVR